MPYRLDACRYSESGNWLEATCPLAGTLEPEVAYAIDAPLTVGLPADALGDKYVDAELIPADAPASGGLAVTELFGRASADLDGTDNWAYYGFNVANGHDIAVASRSTKCGMPEDRFMTGESFEREFGLRTPVEYSDDDLANNTADVTITAPVAGGIGGSLPVTGAKLTAIALGGIALLALGLPALYTGRRRTA
ncbi:MAG TPA: hypothetical protein VF062_07395 [Candidatus Limnocylindrales bacterium]